MIALFNALRKSIGPIIGSALSFFCAFHLINPLATALSPSYSLLLTRGVGGAAILLATIWHICCFASIQPRILLDKLRTHARWPLTAAGWRLFTLFFVCFALAHIAFLSVYLIAGGAALQLSALPLLARRWLVLLVGFGATLFLAWSEELVFRGLVFDHFRRFHGLLASTILSSFLFTIVHNLRAPWALVTTEWRLGLGLFFLGTMLTMIAVWQQSLAASAGAHAGLVFIKVMLRKVPLITIFSHSSGCFPVDLRTSAIAITSFFAATSAFYACISQKKV